MADNLAHDLQRMHDAQLVGTTAKAVHRTLQADHEGIGAKQSASLLFEMLLDRCPYAPPTR